MKKLLCLLTLSLFVSQTSFAGAVNGEQTQSMIKGEENVGDDVQASIITGKVISPKKSPYVFVEYSTAQTSGIKEDGILISKKHVLMGAHNLCKYLDELDKISVKAGDQKIDVVEYAMPASFDCSDPDCRTDDIVVLTLKENVKTNKFLKVAKSAKNIKKKATVQIAGFGKVNDYDSFGTLRQAKAKISNKLKNNFFTLVPYLGTYSYSYKEGSPAVTMQIVNEKKKKAKAIVGIATCYIADAHGQWQDMIMMLSNNKTKKFLKITTNNAVKFF